METTGTLIELAKKVKSISDVGLLYAKDEYNRERYAELLEIAHQLMAALLDQPVTAVRDFYLETRDYPTVKTDVRCLVLNDRQQVLLAKEMADGKWSLPGGWADVGYSARETAEKECREETGLDVTAERLLAVFDKKLHPHPPQPWYVYKFIILCRLKDPAQPWQKGFDVLDLGWFDVQDLPPLSEDRILASQVQAVVEQLQQNNLQTIFD
jgi:ADP-ribose pyrophosphatase YjhB (NUDIX family)